MEKDYEFGPQPDLKIWNSLFSQLRKDGVTIAKFSKRIPNNVMWALIEARGNFFEIDNNEKTGLNIIQHKKLSPYEKYQVSYKESIKTYGDLLNYIAEDHTDPCYGGKPVVCKVYDELEKHIGGVKNIWYLKNKLAGNREKNILENLRKIIMTRNDESYCVLKFQSEDGTCFEYETMSQRITG